MTVGTKTVLWPLVFANVGTLVCLISGRANPVAAALGLVLVVLGLGLLLRYYIIARGRRGVS